MPATLDWMMVNALTFTMDFQRSNPNPTLGLTPLLGVPDNWGSVSRSNDIDHKLEISFKIQQSPAMSFLSNMFKSSLQMIPTSRGSILEHAISSQLPYIAKSKISEFVG